MQRFEVEVTLRNPTDGDEGKTGYDRVLLQGRLPFEPKENLWVNAGESNHEHAEFKVEEVTFKIERRGDKVREYFDILASPPEAICTTQFLIDSFRKVGWTVEILGHDP